MILSLERLLMICAAEADALEFGFTETARTFAKLRKQEETRLRHQIERNLEVVELTG